MLLGLGIGAMARADQFDQLCAGCHGDQQHGGKGGSLLGALKHGDDRPALVRSVREGYPATGMPSFQGLPEGDIQALVVRILERRADAPKPAPVQPLDQRLVRKSERHAFRIEALVTDGLAVPWSFDFLPDGRILLTERAGRLRLVAHGKLQPEPIAGVPPVIEKGEGGLMAVAVHPDHARNRWIYLTFSDAGDGEHAMTKIVRAQLEGDRLTRLENVFALPKAEYPEGFVLFGSRIVFDGDYLFFSVGERNVQGSAQKLATPFGKIHRTFHDGKIPPDNPFVGQTGALESIWAYGIRNPQGLALNPDTHELWEAEHGPRGGDELNRIEKGRNYGWPAITFGMNYDGSPVSDRTEALGMEQPVRHWTPSIAASQVAVYTGDKFPGWRRNVFVGSLAQQKLFRFEMQDGKIVHEELVLSNLGRIRDIKTGPDGLLYLALEQLAGASGWLVRLVPVEEQL